MSSKIYGIVAHDINSGIADKDGEIPWDIQDELRHFHHHTVGNIVILGRKTWERIVLDCRDVGLPGRINYVVSGSIKQRVVEKHEGNTTTEVIIVPTFSLATELALAAQEQTGKSIYICGGCEIYQQAIDNDVVDRWYISLIHQYYECTTFFPQLKGKWSTSLVDKTHPYFTIYTLGRMRQ